MSVCELIMLLVAIILLIIVIAGRWPFWSEKYEWLQGLYNYATLDSMYKDNLFEPGILRRCAEGSYMYTDNPYLGEYCSKVPPHLLQNLACNSRCGYQGKPVRVAYTVPSNIDCNCNDPS